MNFFGSPAWQQIFAQSDRLSFFLRDRFSRQFSKLLSHTHSLSLCLSFFLSLSFSVCPYASSVSCKCCPSANKIYFFVCSACLICFSLSSRPATPPRLPTYSKANNHHRLPEWRSRRRRRRRRQSAKNQPTPTTFDTRMAIKCFEAIFLVYIVFFSVCFRFFFSLFHFAACCRWAEFSFFFFSLSLSCSFLLFLMHVRRLQSGEQKRKPKSNLKRTFFMMRTKKKKKKIELKTSWDLYHTFLVFLCVINQIFVFWHVACVCDCACVYVSECDWECVCVLFVILIKLIN